MSYQDYLNYLEATNISKKACLAKNYLPVPPRDWTRANSLSFYYLNNYRDDLIYIPRLDKYVTPSEAGIISKMFVKGNVLQYPANRTFLTKQVKFSKIVRGLWNQRKKSWASQSSGVTNPNVSQLYRANSEVNPNNENGEIRFSECVKRKRDETSFPTGTKVSDGINFPNIPNPLPQPTSTDVFPIFKEPVELNFSIINGGNLVACSSENLCSGAVKRQVKNIGCYPTSDSDVPGPIINLCYPNNIELTLPHPTRKYTQANRWSRDTFIPALNTEKEIEQTPITTAIFNLSMPFKPS